MSEPHQVSQLQKTHYQVLHWAPGRFRIRVPRLLNDVDYASKLQYLVESLHRVTDVRINAMASSLVVEYEDGAVTIDTIQEQIFTAIQRASTLDLAEIPAMVQEKPTVHEIDYWERLGLPGLGLVLSLGAIAGLPIPSIVIAGVVFAGALPVFKRAWEAIQEEKQLTIDFLDGLAISLHTLQGHYFAPSFMLGLVEGGELIRDLTARGTERASLDLLDCLGKYALVERDGQEIQIPVKDVIEGDHVIVYPGDQIPVDGYVLRGTGLIDQCKLTGESVPVERSEGDEVFASTLVVDGNLCILVERTGNNTRAGVIVSLMQSAPVHDTRVENYAATVANQAVIPTLLIGTGVGLFSGDLNRAIALLTLDLGTGIRVSVPTTILSALTYAARNGVLIRSGRAIEILARIETVVFDKTGTLTVGHAGVTDIKVMDDRFAGSEILALAATAEQGLTHPVAEAIVRQARESQLELKSCEEWEYKVGLGVVAKIDGMRIQVGSSRFMTQEQIDLQVFEQRYPEALTGSCSLVYIAGDGRLLGVVMYSDPPRAESKGVVKDLKQQGITPYMLSGDVTRVARAVAGELGISPNNIYAEAFPERKVEVVKSLHDSGKVVAFCGDGINDSAALAYADVSISFAGATDIARETADVVLMEDDLRGLTHAIRIAKQAMEIIWQNTAIVAVPNIGALISGIVFALDPILAVVINNGTAILAELNGLRPLLGPGGVTPLSHSLDIATLHEEEERLHSHVEMKTHAKTAPTAPQPAGEMNGGTATPEVETPMSAVVVSSPLVDETNGFPPTAEVSLEVEPVFLHGLNHSSGAEPYLSQADLAKRLGLTTQALTRQRSRQDFQEWSRNRDPEGQAWEFDQTTKAFYAIGNGGVIAPPSEEKQVSLV
ncbi:ATPase [Neosynechococcus sphagnicola sy1]|uniref:ATPase n=1 Tax=Neosynechococcus sphagnicola sy1 TaxID=1497020 RepID=A0A098TJ79_9CYAN|nr:ATPase [Neosynechococcus sphagnicola sy1]